MELSIFSHPAVFLACPRVFDYVIVDVLVSLLFLFVVDYSQRRRVGDPFSACVYSELTELMVLTLANHSVFSASHYLSYSTTFS